MTRTRRALLWASLSLLVLGCGSNRVTPIERVLEESREAILLRSATGDLSGARALAQQLVTTIAHHSHALAADREDASRILDELTEVLRGDEAARTEVVDIARHAATTINAEREGDFAARAAAAKAWTETRAARSGPTDLETLHATFYWAVAEYERSQLARADSLYGIIMGALEQDHPTHPLVPRVSMSRSETLDALGRAAEAIDYGRRAVVQAREIRGPSSLTYADARANLGACIFMAGDQEDGEEASSEAAEIYRSLGETDGPNYVVLLQNIAFMRQRLGKDGVKEAYEEVIAKMEELYHDDHPNLITVIQNLGNHHYYRGEKAEARKQFLRAHEISERVYGPDHPTTLGLLNDLAFIEMDSHEYKRAEDFFRRSLEGQRRHVGDGHPETVVAARNYAQILVVLERYAEADSVLSRQVDAMEIMRRRFLGTGLSFGHGSRARTYLAGVRLLRGDGPGAWRALESNLARGLADLLEATGARPLSDEETEREGNLLGRLEERTHELRSLRQGDTPATAIEASERSLHELEAEWTSFQLALARRYDHEEGRPFTLERVQATLAPTTALIGWLDVPMWTGAFLSAAYVIRADGPVRWIPLVTLGEENPAKDVARFRERISSPDSSARDIALQSAEIHRARIASVLPELEGVDDLVVVTSGATAGLPVGAIANADGVYLNDRFDIAYTPSATLYAWQRERASDRPRWGRRALIVGAAPYREEHRGLLAELAQSPPTPDPGLLAMVRSGDVETVDSLSDLPLLPWAYDECLTVAKLFAPSATLMLGLDARETSLAALANRDELDDYSIIHLSTHAVVDRGSPEKSGLVFSQLGMSDGGKGYVDDGFVSAREIVANWKLDADLVTLSACETGLGREIEGEGYVGLTHAFMRAGARSLLVSLWAVHDRSTAMLMERFYATLLNDPARDEAAALRAAKRWLRKQPGFEHPFFWSGFVLLGDAAGRRAS